MDLILWRHAEAAAGAPDLERGLTPRGREDAARVAAWLRERLPAEFVVLASPARRAQETARALCAEPQTVPGLAPGAPLEAILDAAGWPGGGRAVVVVGHQPDLGRAALRLAAGAAGGGSIAAGGLWWLRSHPRGEGAAAVVHAVLAPDLL
ncbi:MAG TPA: histidine phosphatase family protein [Burkholderiales bacterium]|nr:histidine phosphatase family protein [Burkholderiales bacterium]